MANLTILVDFDDVMNNLLEVWVRTLNKWFDLEVPEEAVTEWDMQKAFPMLSKAEIFQPLNMESFWCGVKPKDGAVQALQKLIQDGHSVYVVTASRPQIAEYKIHRVLRRYFPFFQPDNVIIANQKQMILGDILIDDAPHNLTGGKYKGVLFDAPHNQWFDAEANGMYRVRDWDEAYNIINQIKEGII